MDLSDAQEDHLRIGIGRFLAGYSISYFGVTLYTRNRTLHIDSFSDWEPERTDEAHAKAKITRSKEVVAELSAKSSDFMTAICQLPYEFTVCHDYGMGAIALAKEVGGVFRWVYRSEA